MQLQFQIGLGSLPRSGSFYSLLSPLCSKTPCGPQTLTPTIEMVTQSGPNKRPVCANCSKPTQICLCTRLKTPVLQNSVAVTVLQHSLEKKHPLNSTRIATLGLKDVSVISVSDVNFQARLSVHLLGLDHKVSLNDLEEKRNGFGCWKRVWDFVERPAQASGLEIVSKIRDSSNSPEEKSVVSDHFDEELSKNVDPDGVANNGFSRSRVEFLPKNSGLLANDDVPSQDVPNRAVIGGSEDPAIDFTIEKHGAISSFWYHRISSDQCQKQNDFDRLLLSTAAAESVGKGFVVKKVQKKQLNGAVDYKEFDEFEITIPPGSVLLFPSEKSVGIEAIDFEVKNLIVLDGTWAKAKRMYNENPWLKLLPHIKLDADNLSLYGEVRHQPRAGCLSTIESIVYGLKAFGEDSDKLDGLLEVFESMVGDQRRCKNERLSRGHGNS